MESLLDMMGGLLLVAGAAFLLLGGLGLWRMPDLFNRIQAGAKTTTLGTILILAGTAFLHPEWGFKLLLIGLFLLFTNPLSSQCLLVLLIVAVLRPHHKQPLIYLLILYQKKINQKSFLLKKKSRLKKRFLT